MKLCYNETVYSSTLERDLLLCERYGYDLIELRIEFLRDYLKTHTIAELKEFFAAHRLKPYGFNSVDDVNFCGDKQWARVLDEFTFACAMGAELGCSNIVVVPTAGEHMKRLSPLVVFKDSVAVLQELSDVAGPYGARIAFEPIGNRRWCVHTLRQAAQIIREVNRDNVGLTVDAFNIYANEGLRDLEDMRRVPEGKIFVYHINDAMDLPLEALEPARHRLYPGDGVIDLRALNAMLRASGFDEMASLELFGPWLETTDAESIIRVGAQKMRRLIDG